MKILATLVVIFLGVFLIAACGSDAAPTAQPLTKVSIALDWFPWSNHSGLFIAKERGYFADEGLDVEIFTPGDPSTVLQTVSCIHFSSSLLSHTPCSV